jgi:hypothetical protein
VVSLLEFTNDAFNHHHLRGGHGGWDGSTSGM